jgi:hypothetical protein
LHDELIVEHAHATGGDRPHRQLLIAGDAKLADDKDIERRSEPAGHLIGNRHAAARQRQHEHVGSIGIGCELFGEHLAGFAAITK